MNKIIEANCETGEVVERDMTEEEQQLHEVMLLDMANAEQKSIEVEDLKVSAFNKLKALGLTDQEISAILGSV
jgi:hypothetical protein